VIRSRDQRQTRIALERLCSLIHILAVCCNLHVLPSVDSGLLGDIQPGTAIEFGNSVSKRDFSGASLDGTSIERVMIKRICDDALGARPVGDPVALGGNCSEKGR